MARVKDLWLTTSKKRTSKYGKGNRWLAVWIVDGKEKSRSFTTKVLAQEYASKMASDVARGDYLDPDAGRVLIGTLWVKWMDLREITPGTRRRYESCYRCWVEPQFARRAVASVKPSEIAAWQVKMPQGMRRLALMLLTGIFELAVADGAIRSNPCRNRIVAKPPAGKPLQRDGWDANRVRLVSRHCGDYSHIPLIIAGLGLREAEGFGLKLEDFDFEKKIVHIRRQLLWYKGFIVKLPKGEKERTVPLPEGVALLVQRLPQSEWLLTIDGKQIRPWMWRRIWLQALVVAGVIPPAANRDSHGPVREHGLHALRHWYSATLQDGGVSLAGVMDFLGHSRTSAPLAVGVYGHVTETTFEQARRAVDSSLFRLLPVAADGTVTELSLVRDRRNA